MTKLCALTLLMCVGAAGESLRGQGLDSVMLTKPATDAWPTYAGDYSQRRFSTLQQIDTTNVHNLSLAWVRRLTAGPGGGDFNWWGAPPGPPAITGGVAEEPV